MLVNDSYIPAHLDFILFHDSYISIKNIAIVFNFVNSCMILYSEFQEKKLQHFRAEVVLYSMQYLSDDLQYSLACSECDLQ